MMSLPVIDQTGEVVATVVEPTAGQLWDAGLNKVFGDREALYTGDCSGCGADRYILTDSEPKSEELVIQYFECLECGYAYSEPID